MKNKVSIIILAGGKNQRFGGQNKLLLKIHGKTILDILLSKAKTVGCPVILVVNKKKSVELYKKYKINTVVDIIKHRGPLEGIYTGLKKSKTEYNLVLACDMPFVNTKLIKYLFTHCRSYDITIPQVEHNKTVYLEPLCAVYSRRCIPVIKKNIEQHKLAIRSILDKLNVKYITSDTIHHLDPEYKTFTNINSAQEYKKYQ